MPMYDFECKACNHTWETIAKLDEQVPCPACESANTQRLLGAPIMGGQVLSKGVSWSLDAPPNKRGGGRPR
jgi:putative FmdB family regulatory protein